MRIEQSVEDYLEAIHIISQTESQVHQVDVARRLNVSQPAVTKAIRKLKELGYVITEGMHIYLTDAGCVLKAFTKSIRYFADFWSHSG